MADDPEHVTTTEARAGSGPRDMKTVLLVGIGLVTVIFALLLLVWA